MNQNHLKKLEKEHAVLDKKIDAMEQTGIFRDLKLEEMKKQRLHIKDQIATITAQQNKQLGLFE
jgi:uncharacterized protein YdcH (DUF465 family)